MRSNMSIFSFIGNTLPDLFKKYTIDDKFINKRVRLLIHPTLRREEQNISMS